MKSTLKMSLKDIFWLIVLHYSFFNLSCSLITCRLFTLFNSSINENLSINKWCTLYWSREKYFVNRFHITITILFENRFRYFIKLSFRVHGFYYKICSTFFYFISSLFCTLNNDVLSNTYFFCMIFAHIWLDF